MEKGFSQGNETRYKFALTGLEKRRLSRSARMPMYNL
jgi:hypothetical protein